MPKSSLTWLDFSEAERRKMIEIVALFKERDTRDELGLATIRDSFSDRFSLVQPPFILVRDIFSLYPGCIVIMKLHTCLLLRSTLDYGKMKLPS